MENQNQENILELLKEIKLRFSPKKFSNQEIKKEEIINLLEAARSAPSSYNEQPWKFIIGFKGDENFNKIASTLGEANVVWASEAPVLISALTNTKHKRNGKENLKVEYNLGQSVAYLTLQAAFQGMHVHQMGGFNQDELQKIFKLNKDIKPMVIIALGYISDEEEKTVSDRNRKPLEEMLIFEDNLIKV